MSVLVMPGAIQFILILNFPNSEDITLESDSTAALLDEYADLPSTESKAAVDEIFTIEPVLLISIFFIMYCVRRAGEKNLHQIHLLKLYLRSFEKAL